MGMYNLVQKCVLNESKNILQWLRRMKWQSIISWYLLIFPDTSKKISHMQWMNFNARLLTAPIQHCKLLFQEKTLSHSVAMHSLLYTSACLPLFYFVKIHSTTCHWHCNGKSSINICNKHLCWEFSVSSLHFSLQDQFLAISLYSLSIVASFHYAIFLSHEVFLYC